MIFRWLGDCSPLLLRFGYHVFVGGHRFVQQTVKFVATSSGTMWFFTITTMRHLVEVLVIHPLTSRFSFRTVWLVLHSHDNMKINSRDTNLWCSASIGWKKAGTKQTHFKSSFFFFYCKSARANRQSMQIILVFKQIKHSMQQQQKKGKENKGHRGRRM